MAVALVTGSSSGIGLATAVTLARGGHQVIATMRNLDGAGELVKIASAEKLSVKLIALNVDDDVSVDSAISKANRRKRSHRRSREQCGSWWWRICRRNVLIGFPGSHGDQFFRRVALYKGCPTRDARAPSWLHYQCNFDCRPNGFISVSGLLCFQVGF